MSHSITDPRTLGRARVLLVGAATELGSAPLDAVSSRAGWNLRVERSRGPREAIRALRGQPIDLVILDYDSMDQRARRVAAAARKAHPHSSILILGRWPAGSVVAEFLRAGIADWIEPSHWTADDRIVATLGSLLETAVNTRVGANRIAVLESACRRLSQERTALERRLGGACANLAGVEELTRDREGIAAMQAECRTLLAQEAETEPIVEIGANYLIARAGLSNAALFICEGGKYRLAAYVRDDLSRRSAGGLIEHLASQWCAKISEREGIVRLTAGEPAPEGLEGLAGVLPGRSTLAFACRSADSAQPEAVIVLFRDGQRPFSPESERVTRAVGAALGSALERVNRILNRAKPSWPLETPDPDPRSDE
ncbi:MAG: hypothetical protein EXS03_03430 [Phycisphaerales bacterium]|nr:hypothetical protein [Phycisphaerales bacterium]